MANISIANAGERSMSDWKNLYTNPRVVIVSAAIAAAGGLIVSLACCFFSYQAWTGGNDVAKAGGKDAAKVADKAADKAVDKQAAADAKKTGAEVKKNATGRDEFSLTDIEETRRWGRKVNARIKDAYKTGNEFVGEAEREKIKEETKKFISKDVRWEFTASRIETGGVHLSMFIDETKKDQFAADLVVASDQYPNDLWIKLIVGEHISKETVLKLRPGSKIQIDAKIKSIAGAVIILSDIRAR